MPGSKPLVTDTALNARRVFAGKLSALGRPPRPIAMSVFARFFARLLRRSARLLNSGHQSHQKNQVGDLQISIANFRTLRVPWATMSSQKIHCSAASFIDWGCVCGRFTTTHSSTSPVIQAGLCIVLFMPFAKYRDLQLRRRAVVPPPKLEISWNLVRVLNVYQE